MPDTTTRPLPPNSLGQLAQGRQLYLCPDPKTEPERLNDPDVPERCRQAAKSIRLEVTRNAPRLPPPRQNDAAPLFVNGPSPRDVRQGRVGDCWLVASLAAVAHVDPEKIERMITRMPDGSYRVEIYTFRDPLPHIHYVRPPIRQDRAATRIHGKLELWVAVMEHAFEMDRGEIEGDSPVFALKGITGGDIRSTPMGTNMSAEWLETQLTTALYDDHPVVVSTWDDPERVWDPLKPNHSYALLSIEPGDPPLAILYDPAGYTVPVTIRGLREVIADFTVATS